MNGIRFYTALYKTVCMPLFSLYEKPHRGDSPPT